MARNRTIHGVSIDLATIVRDIGALLLVEAGLMLLSVGIALVFREWYTAAGFLVASGATALVGYCARQLFSEAPDPLMKHGMIIAAAGWFVVACFGALPFLLSAYLTPGSVQAAYVPAGAKYSTSSLQYFASPLHALFESMSGWTGSGLTMAVHEPSLPRTIQWWRSLIQWVGGVGVIVLTVSVLERPWSGSYALYRSETREEKIHPSIVSTVRTIWRVFLVYTVLSVVAMVIAIRLSPYGSQLSTLAASLEGPPYRCEHCEQDRTSVKLPIFTIALSGLGPSCGLRTGRGSTPSW